MPPGIPNPKTTPHYYTMSLPHLLLLLSLVSLPLSLSDLSADRAALLLLRSAVAGRTLLWNTTSPSPCSWAGVHCDNNNRVTVLRLPGNSLTGKLPLNVFANLTQLRTLSLRLNNLEGPLPEDLASCTELRSLYLQGNRFSGELPELLFGLKDLVRLNLAGNNFSGEIPAGFNNLTRLGTLFLENNRFTGPVPDLAELRGSLVQFNVSNNLLSGSVPKSLQGVGVSSFAGNSLCGPPFKESCNSSSSSSSGGGGGGGGGDGNGEKEEDDDGGLSGGAIAGIVIGSVVGLLVLVCVVCVLCRRRKKGRKASAVDVAAIKHYQQDVEEGEKMGENGGGGGGGGSNGFSVAAAAAAAAARKGESGSGNVGKLVFFGNNGGGGRGERVFDLEDLLRASAEVLGKGTFGTAYKAVLEGGTVVAVKRLKDVTISEREFREKIELVGAMDHQNLVPLRAYYYSREEKLLVYDYMTLGSLSALLHGNKGAGRTPLNWEFRSTIALGAARGIEYLHSQGSNISHGNIKSSNILLTKSIEARVSDFGLAHLVGPSSTPNRIAGYRAPEVTDPRKVSQKADVYSFGVLLLELLTGKAPTHALLNEEGVDLPRWAQSVVKEDGSSEVFDLELLRYQNVENEMVQLLQLAMDCAEQYPDKRPSMSEVTKRIEGLSGSNAKDDHLAHPHLVNEEN